MKLWPRSHRQLDARPEDPRRSRRLRCQMERKANRRPSEAREETIRPSRRLHQKSEALNAPRSHDLATTKGRGTPEIGRRDRKPTTTAAWGKRHLPAENDPPLPPRPHHPLAGSLPGCGRLPRKTSSCSLPQPLENASRFPQSTGLRLRRAGANHAREEII